MADPRVSVIIPTWNRAIEVRQAIASILAQTYANVEVVVVDDGSTDETPSVLASYGKDIVAIRQENAGVSAARNTGIRAAKGEFLAFVDSDDTFEPTKIAKQVALLEAAGASAACCLSNAFQVSPDGKSNRCFEYAHFRPALPQGLLLNPVEIFLTRHILINQNVLVRKSVMESLGLFDESLSVLEDHDLALRLGLVGPWAYTTEPLATIHRDTRHSLTTRAYGNELVVFESLVTIYGRFLEIGTTWHVEHPRREGEKLSPSELRHTRRNLTRTRSELDRIRRGETIGPLRTAYERIAGAIWSRSPLFPDPKVEALPALNGN
jgi:glycosyltransferase involved in cell wall biosynthesis